MPSSAAAIMPHHLTTIDEAALADCDDQPGLQGDSDHQDQDSNKDDAKLSHRGCCVMACAMSALEPFSLQEKPVVWSIARTQIVTDDMLRDRAVSPLRRPPRAAA